MVTTHIALSEPGASRTSSRWILPIPIIGALFLVSQLLPPLPQYVGLAISMALGTALVCLLLLFVGLTNDLLASRLLTRNALVLDPAAIGMIAGVLALLLLHAAVADWFQDINLGRFVASLVPLALLLLATVVMAKAVEERTDTDIDRILRWSFAVLLGVAALHFTPFQPRGNFFPKATFPFTETSHFALAIGPVLMYHTVRSDTRNRKWWVAACFAIAIGMKSTALLAGCFLIATAARRILLVAQLSLPLLLAAAPLGLQYFAIRLNIFSEEANITTLVYIQGWQQIWEALSLTGGWGVGFQQLGVHGTDVPAAELIRAISGLENINVTDGGFVLAKLVSELGIVAIVLVLLYLRIAQRCMRHLRARRGGSAATFARCVVIFFSVDIFLRGLGYFTQSTLMFLVALWILWLDQRRRQAALPCIQVSG